VSAEQERILNTQFQIKDYLSRKEMRSVARKADLTDAQVRDWFKARRIQEDTPMIVDEKHSEVMLSSSPVIVKQEPLDEVAEAEIPIIENPNIELAVNEEDVANVVVKQEPEDEPDSAVLDPLTGNLLKKSNVDKKLEDILAKAPLLDALTKKIEMVSKPANTSKDKMKDQLSDIIDILDDEIEITKENIVNPGPKEKPLNKVLNKFLSQVEQLEKSMDVNEFSKNIEIEVIVKENKRKDEIINDLTAEVSEKKEEIANLGKELNDKNDDIESILLNSVSKETFIRSQFQSLTSEVRKLKQDKADAAALQEKIRDLEVKLRKKSHEVEDLKTKYDSSQTQLKKKDQDIKDVEEMSTKLIGDITKGIGEKLATAKTKEQELISCQGKNETLESDLKELEKRFKQQNDDLIRIKADEKANNEQLSEKFAELAKSVKRKDEEVFILRSENDNLILKIEGNVDAIKSKDEEIDKLKEQVNNLTSRFRNKVKEIQETLSNYNETLKSKNKEIVEQAEEILELKGKISNQVDLITKLEHTSEVYAQEIVDLKLSKETMKKCLDKHKAVVVEREVSDSDKSPKSDQKKRKFSGSEDETISIKRMVFDQSGERGAVLTNVSQVDSASIFLSPLSLQFPLPHLSLGYNWPVVPYSPPASLLGNITSSQVEKPARRGTPSCKRKKSTVGISRKRFRISVVNRPVFNLKQSRH